MSFFLPKGKRKFTEKKVESSKKKKLIPRKNKSVERNGNIKGNRHEDDEILSDDPDVEGTMGGDNDEGYPLSPEDTETAEEKRLRLAKKYLEEIEKEEKKRRGFEDDEDGEEGEADQIHAVISKRLKREELEEIGKYKHSIAESYTKEKVSSLVRDDGFKVYRDHKCHKQSVTSLAISQDGKYMFSGSKDCGLIMWDLDTGEKLARVEGGRKGTQNTHKGHCMSVNAIAVSSDSKFLASGDHCNLIHIWEVSTQSPFLKLIHTFKGHRDAVSGLAFRRKTHTLYSCSFDRSIKIWDLDEMSYIETLFGHQDKITGIDAGIRERAISAGGRDGSVRVWKIVEESQLIFNGPMSSIDAVKLINEEHFVTCGEDGRLSLWSVIKKKPLHTLSSVHGTDPVNQEPRWVSALATLPSTDLIATGSHDGYVRLWKCSNNFRSLKEINSIPVQGFINALAFTPDGLKLVAAIGQEHRLGRWWRIKEARNSLVVLHLNPAEKAND